MLQYANPIPHLQPPAPIFAEPPSRTASTTPSYDNRAYIQALSRRSSTQNSIPQLYRSISSESTHSGSHQLPALSALASLAANASVAAIGDGRYVDTNAVLFGEEDAKQKSNEDAKQIAFHGLQIWRGWLYLQLLNTVQGTSNILPARGLRLRVAV